MKTQLRKVHAFAIGIGLAILAFSGLANADPPSRVARLAYVSGDVRFSPAGDDDWVRATLNRPLTTGDRVWADGDARAELQIGGTAIRLAGATDVALLNLDDRIAQLRLAQGVLNVRVRRLSPGQMIEVDTPNLAFTVRQPGAYRVEVDADGDATTIFVRDGEGEVYGDGASYVIDERQPYRFTGTDLRDYRYVAMPGYDDFDRWSSDRDRYYDNSTSARYVSDDVIGYTDLDEYGRWESDPSYGHVWVPTRVAIDWAPYRDGHWAWIDPWGWTWVDEAPWGFAVSHYGRWAHRGGRWCWVPGPVQQRAYYAPALVAFVGGNNFQISISTGPVFGVAWFPLAPHEVYRPAYRVSRGYFEHLNRSNTIVSTTIINNYYNTTNITNVVYANRRVPGAVVAVPHDAFVHARPIRKEVVRVTEDRLVTRPVAVAPSVAPTERSVRGRAERGGRPPAKVLERTVVAREAPPAKRPKFAEVKEKLAANPGKPLDDDVRREAKGPSARPDVKVVARADARPTQKLAAVAPERRGDAGRKDADGRKNDAAKGGADRNRADDRKVDTGRNAADDNRRDAARDAQDRKTPQPPARVEAPRPPKQAEDSARAARPPVRDDQPAKVARPPQQSDDAARVQRPPVQTPRPPQERARAEQPASKQPGNAREQRDQQARFEESRRQPPVVRSPEQRSMNGQRDEVQRVAPPRPPMQQRAQGEPPKPPVPQAPPAPPVQPTPREQPVPQVRIPKPPRTEGQARPDQPRRAPQEQRQVERKAKSADDNKKK